MSDFSSVKIVPLPDDLTQEPLGLKGSEHDGWLKGSLLNQCKSVIFEYYCLRLLLRGPSHRATTSLHLPGPFGWEVKECKAMGRKVSPGEPVPRSLVRPFGSTLKCGGNMQQKTPLRPSSFPFSKHFQQSADTFLRRRQVHGGRGHSPQLPLPPYV